MHGRESRIVASILLRTAMTTLELRRFFLPLSSTLVTLHDFFTIPGLQGYEGMGYPKRLAVKAMRYCSPRNAADLRNPLATVPAVAARCYPIHKQWYGQALAQGFVRYYLHDSLAWQRYILAIGCRLGVNQVLLPSGIFNADKRSVVSGVVTASVGIRLRQTPPYNLDSGLKGKIVIRHPVCGLWLHMVWNRNLTKREQRSIEINDRILPHAHESR